MTQTATELAAFADDVWLSAAPVSFLGLRLTATTTVVRLAGCGLLVHSPGPLTATLRQQTDALGPVRHLYAPNLFHHRGLEEGPPPTPLPACTRPQDWPANTGPADSLRVR